MQSDGLDPSEILTGELLDMSEEYLCKCLCRFVMESKKPSGDDYPRETLYDILLSLQVYFHMNGKTCEITGQHQVPDFAQLFGQQNETVIKERCCLPKRTS